MKETSGIGPNFELNGFGKYMALVIFVDHSGNYRQFNRD